MTNPTAAINLAYWIAKFHPTLFRRLQILAAPNGLGRIGRLGLYGRLGQDVSFISQESPTSFSIDPTLQPMPADIPDMSQPPGSFLSQETSSSIDPDLIALQPVNVDVPDITNSSEASIASAPIDTSSSALSSASSGLTSALASVGKWLSSAPGLSAVTNLATSIYKSGTPQASAINTQVARTQAGVNPAAITYGYNSLGQLVPVLQPAGTAGLSLDPTTLAQLVPPTLQPYIVPIVAVVAILALLGAAKGK